MAYEQITFSARFIVCKECGSLVLLWKTDIHDKVCPGMDFAPIAKAPA